MEMAYVDTCGPFIYRNFLTQDPTVTTRSNILGVFCHPEIWERQKAAVIRGGFLVASTGISLQMGWDFLTCSLLFTAWISYLKKKQQQQ
jgi:hypothetical protein